MEYLSLVFLHILFGVVWAGGAISAGLFFIPSVAEAGPGGGLVVAGLVKRKFPVAMTVSGIIVVLSGARMYMIRFSSDWVSTPEGLVLSLGALLGLGAMALGLIVQKPTAERLGALGAQVAGSGAPPTPAQAAELKALREKMTRIGRLIAWHLIGAVTLMAMHRLAAAM
ncbi:MAG: hypothetical protein ABI634_03360 [Acidobacteriota bacterium]